MKPHRLVAVLSLALAGCVHTPSAKDVEAATYYYDIAVNETLAGNTHEAVKNLKIALDRNPYFADAHNALGLVYHLSLGRTAEAEKSYLEALRLRPDFSEASNNLGALYLDQQRWADAEPLFRKALEDVLYPTPHLARGNLGWCLYKQGRLDEALVELKQAVIMQPKFCVGYRNLGHIYDEQNRAAEAQQAWRSFVKHCPDNAEAQYRWGIARLAQADEAAALKAFLACWRADPDGPLAADCASKVELLGGDLAPEESAPKADPEGDIALEAGGAG